MRMGWAVTAVLAFTVFQGQAQAPPQSEAVPALAGARAWEYGALFQGGNGLTQDRNGFQFFMAGVHLGKVLTPEIGKGYFRGNVEYAGELFPYW